MTKWVTVIDKDGVATLSEQYKDAKEKCDNGSQMIFGEVRAEVRARGLNLQRAEGSQVIVSDEEYDPTMQEVDA
jgi:hypothetical protein